MKNEHQPISVLELQILERFLGLWRTCGGTFLPQKTLTAVIPNSRYDTGAKLDRGFPLKPPCSRTIPSCLCILMTACPSSGSDARSSLITEAAETAFSEGTFLLVLKIYPHGTQR